MEIKKSNLAENDSRLTTIAVVINGASCWGINNTLTGAQINKIVQIIELLMYSMRAFRKANCLKGGEGK